MKCKFSVVVLFSVMLFALPGCLNMPTKTSQITATHVSDIKYQNYTCTQLSAEYNSFSRREAQLVTAQDQRHSTSQVQAFWWGVGQGDGIEASELAVVRGEREAIMRMMEKKGCAQFGNIQRELDLLSNE